MLAGYLRIAFRVFIRNRAYTLINIAGLAIGLTFSIIIFLYAYKELNYDRFHANADRLFRVGINARLSENELNLAVTSTPLARTMLRDIPDVENSVRVARFGAWLLRNDSIRYNEDNLIFSDPGFFTIFSFPFISGSPDEALNEPNSVVLTETAARKYFPGTDPLGKKLRVENDSTFYTVTGVMKDVPENSHLKFDMVGAISTYEKMLDNDRWIINYLYTYFLLKENGDLNNVQQGLNYIVEKFVVPDYTEMLGLESSESFNRNNYFRFVLQPLEDIHYDTSLAGNPAPVGKHFYMYLFIILALVIMVLSCMNFINMVTAHSVHRAREVGIRKISGSERKSLIQQFLIESSLMAFLSLAIALLLIEISLPAFSKFIGLELSLRQLLNSEGILLLIFLIFMVGVISGLYPAFYLSSYHPKTVLRNLYGDHPDKGHFRIGLTVFQLFLAIGVLTMTLIVNKQYRFLLDKDRGYDTENLLVIRRPDALTGKLEDFKNNIRQVPGVRSVTNATSPLGGGFPRYPYYPEGKPATSSYSAATLMVSYDYESTYRLQLKEGRFFDKKYNDTLSCIINETAAVIMGITDPVGKNLIKLSDKPGKATNHKIIGVVKDFNYEPLENPVKPLVILFLPGNYEGYMTVKLENAEPEAITYIQKTWEKYTEAYPFVYYFLDEDRRSYYQPVQTTARLFVLLSIVTSLLACLSLFALVAFYYNRKQKEIGVLKTLGASKISLILKRAGEIVILILMASVGAWICAFVLASYWLKDYAYHISLNLIFFFGATLVLTILSLAAVYYHTYLAARANPGTLLKYE
jgi:putative ABC transport system permease protein